MRWGWVWQRQRQSICRARAGVREFTSLLAASPAPWARGCVIRYTHIPTHATGNLLADWAGSVWKDCRPLPSSRQRARAGQPAEVFVLSQQPPSLHATLTLTTPERTLSTLPGEPSTPRARTVQGAVCHRPFGGAHYGTTLSAIVARRRAAAFALPLSPLWSLSADRDILRLFVVNLGMAIELGYARYYWQTLVDTTT
jgi:hypothetical protein